MSVRLSVRPLQIDSSFLFLDRIEPFWPSVLHVALYKRCSSIFDLVPLTSKIYSAKFLMARVWWKLGSLHTQRLAWHHCDVITYYQSWMSMARHTCHNSIHGTTMLANEILVTYRLVCLSVCHKHYFFLLSRWNRAISWPSVFHDKNYKTVFSNFWFRPPNAQNLLPKICICGSLSQS